MEEDRDKGLEDLETDAGRGRGRGLQADAGSRPDPDQEAGPGLEIDLDHIRQLATLVVVEIDCVKDLLHKLGGGLCNSDCVK